MAQPKIFRHQGALFRRNADPLTPVQRKRALAHLSLINGEVLNLLGILNPVACQNYLNKFEAVLWYVDAVETLIIEGKHKM